eukprot:1755915-Pyramimonas_sp.AAC.1
MAGHVLVDALLDLAGVDVLALEDGPPVSEESIHHRTALSGHPWAALGIGGFDSLEDQAALPRGPKQGPALGGSGDLPELLG